MQGHPLSHLPTLSSPVRFGDNTLQDQINVRSLAELTSYCTKYKECLGSASELPWTPLYDVRDHVTCHQAPCCCRRPRNVSSYWSN